MSRVIKFRAWDKSDNSGMYETIAFEDMVKMEIMQFTGLKDKNGKEIYEGDIISTPKGICAVTFELGCFYAITVSMYRLGGWNTDSIEVLGNIYQNPELLETVQK